MTRIPDKAHATGIVFELQRWSIHDGPGTRTVVFLKGCPLRCLWCSNPESQVRQPQLALVPTSCINCRTCVRVCPTGAALPASRGGFRDRSQCSQCGACVEACPAAARQWMGKRMSADEVMAIIERDTVFYRRSGGGVTFSGGEPLTQPVFLSHLLERSRAVGIHTALETSGYFRWRTGANIVRTADLVFLDLKHMDPAVHRKITGVSNELILRNAVEMSHAGVPLIIRIPVVPSLTDSAGNIRATAEFVAGKLASAKGIELLPYHELGKAKYAGLGLRYELDHVRAPLKESLDALGEIVARAGVPNLTSADCWEMKPTPGRSADRDLLRNFLVSLGKVDGPGPTSSAPLESLSRPGGSIDPAVD